MNVSGKNKEFLENLRLYLMSSGKNEKEIEEIVGELEDHLSEAEARGKNVEDIIGGTPKDYMQQIANEMSFDVKGWIKYIPILVLCVIAYQLLGDGIRGGIDYSLLEVVGTIFILSIFVLFLSVTFKYVSSRKVSKVKEYALFSVVGSAPISLFVGLIYLDRYYEPPSLELGTTGNIIAIIISISVFIVISIWSKTWVSIIIPALLFLPELLLNMTNLQEEVRLIINGIAVPLCIAIYVFAVLKIETNKNKRYE